MDIRILPSNIANMIAAGEVVQRPASVVKELIENAVDAGAQQISVMIKDAGRTLIQVIDDGCGMSPDDAVLCFERHATSKIAEAEDLMDIGTFGFRGEALASIAAVSEVTLKTRREEDEIGCEVVFADSVNKSTSQVNTPRGCNFAVRNLFYNVPARRKFLKSDNIEMKHIISEFTRVALTRPEISFTLVHNGKEIFVLKPAISLKFRIQNIFGAKVAEELVDVNAETSVVRISGYVSRPSLTRKGVGNQFFFANGRYFRSNYLHKAVMQAYEHLIPPGVTPSYFIYLEVDPHNMDVNIHPAKTELKFEDDSVIYQSILACIRQSVGQNAYDKIDFDIVDAPRIPVMTENSNEYRPVFPPVEGLDPSYNPFEDDGFPNFEERIQDRDWSRTSDYVTKSENYGKLFEDRSLPSKSVIVLQNRYILTVASSGGLMAVNVRRARERILFERFLAALGRDSHVTQTLLFPVTVQVGAENMTLFEEHAALLSSLGFDIAPFGTDTIVINGVPEGYSAEGGKVEAMVSDIIVILSDNHLSLQETMASAMAEKFARLGACSDINISSTVEAQRLIDALFACENAEYTSSGHKIFTVLPIDEFDKRIG